MRAYIVIRATPSAKMAATPATVRLVLRKTRPNFTSLEVQQLTEGLEVDYRPLPLGAITIGSFALLAVIGVASRIQCRTTYERIRHSIGLGCAITTKSALGRTGRNVRCCYRRGCWRSAELVPEHGDRRVVIPFQRT